MHARSIELLNKALREELLAINQYMYFHFHCDDQGLDLLSSLFKRIAIEEMGHVEILSERILFLKGEVEMDMMLKVEKIKEVEQMLISATTAEEEAVVDYNKFAIESANNSDAMSKQIFESIIADEERHYSLLDSELSSLKKYGDKYLTLQSIERSKSNSTKMNPTA
ncbi:MAG: ferritin-like domain-containing protein [Nitrospinota bacterium]